MSQLHVFQGISGTGKTSLAKAFAKAMGGFCTDIAVQAGWRDRDDLLGHYNALGSTPLARTLSSKLMPS